MALSQGRVFVTMMCGPGEGAIAIDTMRSVRHSHPDAEIWVWDDATGDGTWETVNAHALNDGRVQHRRGELPHGYAGVCRSLFSLLDSLAAERQPTADDIIMKIDPDSLVLDAGMTRVVADLFVRAGGGLAGAIHKGPNGQRRDLSRQARNQWLDSLPIGPAKVGGRLRIGWPFWWPAFRKARRNGYRMGESVQGGGFHLSGASLMAMHRAGWLRVPGNYAAMTFEEDIVIAILAVALGHPLVEYADTGRPWWIQYRPPLPSEEVLAARPDLVHPLKDVDRDWALRAALRNQSAV